MKNQNQVMKLVLQVLEEFDVICYSSIVMINH